jgi:septal ring factor EnvC (AmiA/AmiB activator)
MLWLFLPFVIVLSGVVAYAADTIARKAGRKHIRLFGLRPKTTALLVAVLSGMGISAASLAAFLALNSSAVNTIAQADQLRPQLEALRTEIGGVQAELRAAQADRDRAQQEAQTLRAQQQTAQRDLKSTRADLNAARAAEQTLTTQAADLERRVRTLTATRTSLERRAEESRLKLTQSEQALDRSQQRAQTLDAQVVDLAARIALSEQETRTAQERAAAAQQAAEQVQQRAAAQQAAAQAAQRAAAQQAQQARAQVTTLSGQVRTLNASRAAADSALNDAQAALTRAREQQQAAQQARDRLLTERAQLTAERDAAARDRDRVRAELTTLQAQQAQLRAQQTQLRASNEALGRDLAAARETLGRLQDEYSSSRAELSASRNTDLAYPKNDLVYAAVVPSVRNLDAFLADAARSAQARGAKGTPSVRLNAGARSLLETKLRGLNVSTFVQCRAAQNAAVGFPVDLSCDARPNAVLYRGDQIIRRATLNLNVTPGALQEQVNDLVKDTVLDITTRGVPSEYVQGLDVTELVTLLSRLGARSGAVATVGIAARQDVRPGTRVDLYPVLP